jgi:fibronectin-binding autotransporter adhesin
MCLAMDRHALRSRLVEAALLLAIAWAGTPGVAETTRFSVPWAGGTIAPGNTVVIEHGGSITADVVADGMLRFERSGTLTVSSTISGTGSLAIAGTGTVALAGLASGTANFDLAISVPSGQLLIGSTGGSPLTLGRSGVGSIEVSGGLMNNGNASVGAAQGGLGTATVSSGTWTNRIVQIGQSGTGSLTLQGGRMTATTAAIGTSGGVGMAVVSGGTWVNASQVNVGGYLTTGGTGSLTITAGRVTGITNNIAFGETSVGTVIVSGGEWLSTNAVSVLHIGRSGSGTLSMTGGLLSFASGTIGTVSTGVGAATITGGTWSTSGGLVVGGSGAGTLLISGSGGIGGTVVVGGTLSRGAAGTITLGSGGTLRIGSGTTTGVLATSLVNNGTLVFAPSGTSVLAHAVSGTGTLTMAGPGRLVVAGTSGISGATTVAGGTLLVNGGLGSTAVWVETGGLLGGTGSITGAITVNRDATLAPGASIETLLTGDVTWLDGSTFEVEVDSSVPLAVAADLLKVDGDVTISGTVSLDLVDLAASPALFPAGTTLSLLTYSGTWNSGLFSVGGAPLADGGSLAIGSQLWTIDYDAVAGGSNFSSEYLPGGRFVNVTVVPVPEPVTLGLLLAGLCCVVGPLLRNGLPVARSR